MGAMAVFEARKRDCLYMSVVVPDGAIEALTVEHALRLDPQDRREVVRRAIILTRQDLLELRVDLSECNLREQVR